MDEEISKWIVEFLLRQKLDEKLINGLLESLPLKDEDNNRLKKTLLLRKIEFEASSAEISEKILDFLEIIEEIDHREGKSASDSMKKAYCDVAVDCTFRFLDENAESNANFVDAINRVWRKRVCKVEGLACEESKRRLWEIERAVLDSAACEELLRINTRNEALRSIRVYLAESRRSLGPTFLELVADKSGNALVEHCAGGGEPPVGRAVEPRRESQADGEIPEVQVPLRRKHIAVKSKRRKGAKISDANEGNEDSVNPSPEVENVRAPVTPTENTENGVEDAEKVNPTRDLVCTDAKTHQMKLRDPKSSWMDPNRTAHTCEWNDSIENFSYGTSQRPGLASPDARQCSSPLKSYEYGKFSRKRPRKKWTPLEEDALKIGVEKFGKGNWKLIWQCYRDTFGDRTEVDLKDKWRNMSR